MYTIFQYFLSFCENPILVDCLGFVGAYFVISLVFFLFTSKRWYK